MKLYNQFLLPLRLLVELYGFLVGLLLLMMLETARLTCSVEIDGLENLQKNPHAIWACWHEFVICSFVTLPIFKKFSRPQSWLNHPAWVMRPTHRLMDYYGIDVVMGASGEHGREAAAEVLKRLRSGESTSIYPDGPSGPKHKIKSGVLSLARDSGLPILAFHYSASHYWRWPGWDRKIVPIPFSRVNVRISSPIYVSEPEASRGKLQYVLSGNG